MIVKCIENNGRNLPIQLFSHQGWNSEMEFDEITIGRIYIVYSIIHVEDVPFYLICGDSYDGEYVTYPSLFPSNLFEITQNQQSKFWQSSKDSKNIGFKEILFESHYYGKLVEGYKKETQTFLTIKQKIDQENINL